MTRFEFTHPSIWMPPTLLAFALACHSSSSSVPDAGSKDAGSTDAGFTDAGSDVDGGPLASIPVSSTITDSSLSATVDVVRDQEGIPHIFGATIDDAVFAQGYLMAQDRWFQMDLARRQIEGTLAALLGGLSPATLTSDIQMRLHHQGTTAAAAWAQLQASTTPSDVILVTILQRFADGVNAYLATLANKTNTLPSAYSFVYGLTTPEQWTPTDTLAVGRLLTFEQAFSAENDINRSQILASAVASFDMSTNPVLAARSGIGLDLQIFTPVDPTFTLPSGWTSSLSCNDPPAALNPSALALYLADSPTVMGIGRDKEVAPARGSNNWVVGPALTADGNSLLANDPHLSLSNPATFWMVHVVATGGPQPANMMGLAIPGVPGVVLGFNQHIAWGATDSYVDTTDVYSETVVPCSTPPDGGEPDGGELDGGAACVIFDGGQVPVVPRVESIQVGSFGNIQQTLPYTFFDVPQHGPIIPRITSTNTIEPLSSSELSIAYTGYEVTQEVRALFNVMFSSTMQDAANAFAADFKVGGFNWVIVDDQGHFGWTEANRIPTRAAGSMPWRIMPGDGTAEWGPDLALEYIPHAYNPDAGFIATANNDPIGVTANNDPLGDAPVVNGVPLYIGAPDYDPGTRVGRITKQIKALSGNHKLTLDDMQTIQADTITEWGQFFNPTALAAAQALAAEIATPGSNSQLTAMVQAASSGTLALVPTVVSALTAWSYDTPTGVAEDSPTAAQITDSQATLIFNVWLSEFANDALGDELAVLNVGVDDDATRRLLFFMVTDPSSLASGLDSNGESVLFDNINTTPIETQLQISAQAVLDALTYITGLLGTDPTKWQWGAVHTLTLDGVLPVPSLQVPLATDPTYPNGWPRHGDTGTVDVGEHQLFLDTAGISDFSYDEGPQQRLAVEMTPQGPVARNVLPGGEVFDPASPHYADLIQLWRKNKTFNVALSVTDVVTSGLLENSANGDGHVQFVQ